MPKGNPGKGRGIAFLQSLIGHQEDGYWPMLKFNFVAKSKGATCPVKYLQ